MLQPRQIAFCVLLLAITPQHVSAQTALTSGSPQSATPAIRVSTNLVHVGVNVTNSRGHFVAGLHSADFEVFDNGVRQPIADFGSEEDPAQVVLLIEDGAIDWFMAKLHRSLLADAGALVARIPSNDRVAILTYAKRTELVSPFTSDKEVSRGALLQLNEQLEHSAAIPGAMDLSVSLADTLDWLSTTHGGKTIVLFSTGFDSTPPDEWIRIHQRIAASDVRVLAISVFGDLRVPEKRHHLSPDDRDDRAFLKQGIAAADLSLRQLSAATGGRVFFPKNAKEFDAACSSISQLIRGRYTLAFAPTAFDGRLHAIDVKLKGHYWDRVEHRQAYLASLVP